MYLADTNIYIVSTNDTEFRIKFEEFLNKYGPIPASSIVVAEILFGTTDIKRHLDVIHSVTAGTVAIAPTVADWETAATAIAKLGGEAVTKSRSFWNDALLAAQCARLGLTLVTHNTDDFSRLKQHISVDIALPFP